MPKENFLRRLLHLDLEEKILNGASFIAFLCVFFPWTAGEWLGRPVTFSGLGFFTSFIGLAILLLHLTLLLITIVPLAGGPVIVRRQNRDLVRLFIAALAAVLTLAAWSVLTKFTLEFSRIEIHFGLYGTLIGSMAATLYTFLKYQEQRKRDIQALFGRADDEPSPLQAPPPDDPEDHPIHF